MPCWSPDGKSIAFHSDGILWTLDLGTGKFQKILKMDKKLIVPFDWTPDGKFIIVDVRDTQIRGEADIWRIAVNENLNKSKPTDNSE